MSEISIIIPIYNAIDYLYQCIDSILNQTYQEFELILIDDGSTDGSTLVCDEYAKMDYRVKVYHKENGGVVSARKYGFRQATGKYIFFVDADDWLEPVMVEKLFTTMKKQNVDIVMCGRFEDTGDISRAVCHGIKGGRYDKAALQNIVYPKMLVNGDFFEWGLFPGFWDKLFRKECLESYIMAVNEKITMGEDAACVYPCLLHVDSIYVLEECLYHYRQISTSMVKKKEKIELERERFQILYRSVKKIFEQARNIYDLTEQWRDYVLFLMVARADTLYRGIEKLDYLFPFPRVKKGSNIILYGIGPYGQRLYKFLLETDFCNVVALVDRNYQELKKQGFPVQAPDDIGCYDCDAIVVTISFAKARKSVYETLIKKYPKEKIHLIDETLIKSNETLKAFGLM